MLAWNFGLKQPATRTTATAATNARRGTMVISLIRD
jgi:hypothetical protein